MTPGKRRDGQRLDDMLKSIREIEDETIGLGREEYQQNRLVQKAVTYDIMCLGEAASRVSQRTKKANPQIPWAELARYRSDEEEGPAHAYFNFDFPGTWTFIRDVIPKLGGKLRKVRVPSENR